MSAAATSATGGWWGDLRRAIGEDPRARAGAILLIAFVAMALLGPLLVGDPTAPVGKPLQPPSAAHWLGTTGQGQDVFAQTVCGTRASLGFGLLVGVSVVAVGAIVGMLAGYAGGFLDATLSLVTNVFLVIPGLPLAVVAAAYLPSGPVSVALVLIVSGWPWNARVVRAQTLSLRSRDFIAAAIVGGMSRTGILARQILPNLASLLVGQVIGSTVYAIGAQVGLEFLGLGDVSRPTWGTNLYWASNDSALLTGAWWTFVPTGTCVALVGFALAMLNSGFDEITNPKLGVERQFRAALPPEATEDPTATPVVPHV
jgi:peptide/nickel transport system permease protein